jgi:hypothetical protein
MFAEHPVLRLIYEDLARRPVRTAERVAEFLGLSSQANAPTVKYRKTGQEKLSDAVVDYEALLAKMQRWSSFSKTNSIRLESRLRTRFVGST